MNNELIYDWTQKFLVRLKFTLVLLLLSNNTAKFLRHNQLQITVGNYCYLQCGPNEISSQTRFLEKLYVKEAK